MAPNAKLFTEIPTELLITADPSEFHPPAEFGHGLTGTFIIPKGLESFKSTDAIERRISRGQGARFAIIGEQMDALNMAVSYVRINARGPGSKMTVAKCPLGTFPIGGGCAGGYISVNAPTVNGRGWKCGGSESVYGAEAICSGDYGQLTTVSEVGMNTSNAKCDDGYTLISGGCQTASREEPIRASYPGEESSWTCEVRIVHFSFPGTPSCLLPWQPILPPSLAPHPASFPGTPSCLLETHST